ncbi:MAG: hypothetical protein RSF88_06370, partial [Lachnospiraceae bacterium]
MNVLVLDSPSFAKLDMIHALETCGFSCDLFYHQAIHQRRDADFESSFGNSCKNKDYLFVFSFNYFPILA